MVPLVQIRKRRFPIHRDRTRVKTHQEVPQSMFQAVGGSLTIEAALVFPLCLFLLVGLLSFFQVLQVVQVTGGALASAGGRLSLETGGIAGSQELELARAVGYFHQEMWEEEKILGRITGGRLGILWNGTDVSGDYVDLKINYRCPLPVALPGLRSIVIRQRIYVKKWTGRQETPLDPESSEDAWVYLTPNGEVYHVSKRCTHLKLSIESISKDSPLLGAYQLCQLCGKQPAVSACYYITQEGRRYHIGLECSGLKRTIYMVKLSKIHGTPACSRCGGK